MKLGIVGTGYVGLVTGACFAEMGNTVVCVDIDEAKLESLARGEIPIHEPGLEELVTSNTRAGRLTFTSDLSVAMEDAEVIFIAVGTPPNEDGSADLSHVLAVAESIGQKLEQPLVVADKSTVPVGTADKVRETISAELEERGVSIEFDVVSNPEFLREGSAIKDFMYPDRIVVGTDSTRSQRVMLELYDVFGKKEHRIQFVGVRDAEMIKYAANTMLATKISFMNEVALMCDSFGVDVESVRRGIGTDPRIGPAFIYPGCGYGGSCFPKDVRAMIHMAEQAGLQETIFEAVERRNDQQQLALVEKIKERFGDISGMTFALWGLAFKPDTDDIRNAPALRIAAELAELGAEVACYDPQAMEATSGTLSGHGIRYVDDPYSATEGADALIVATEWRQFKQPDFRRLQKQLSTATIFDGRNIYNPERCNDYGLNYIGIGRSALVN